MFIKQHSFSSWRNWILQSRRVLIFSNFRNYGPTLKQANDVIKSGHHQVLWLYGDEVIEAGTSNIFFVFKPSGPNGKVEVVTPALRDLILPGVTRDSIMVYLSNYTENIWCTSWICYDLKTYHYSISALKKLKRRITWILLIRNCSYCGPSQEYRIQRIKS